MPHQQRGTKTPTHPILSSPTPSLPRGPALSPRRRVASAPNNPLSIANPHPKHVGFGRFWSVFLPTKTTPTQYPPSTYTQKPPPKTAQTFIVRRTPKSASTNLQSHPQSTRTAQDRTNH